MNYEELQALFGYESGIGQVEQWHGLLCGLLSAGRPTSVEQLHQILYEITGLEGELLPAQEEALAKLLQVTSQQLAEGQIEFNLLLPDDEESLSQRTQSLSGWCDTFLYGLSAGGLDSGTELSPDVAEFITDLTEISHVESEDDLSGEQDEFYFVELVEYVRVGVLMINDDLNLGGPRQQQEH